MRRLERTLPDGASQSIDYDDFEAIGGILFNHIARIRYRGELVREVYFRSIAPNEAGSDLFRRPQRLDEQIPAPDPGIRDFSAREIADGIWFIGEGVQYQIFVEFADFAVAMGSVGGVDKRLEEFARRVPGKSLRYAIVSHHHNDHFEGVVGLAQASAVLVTAPSHESVGRDVLGAVPGIIETGSGVRVITDGHREMRILQIGPNSHADEMLAGYLPREKILFTADLLVQPPERPIRGRIPPIRDLAIAIDAFQLQVDMLVDPHSPRLNSPEDLATSMSR